MLRTFELHFRHQNLLLPIGVLDADRLLLLLLNVTLPDANEDANQEQQSEHAGTDLHDFHVADHWRYLINDGLRII